MSIPQNLIHQMTDSFNTPNFSISQKVFMESTKSKFAESQIAKMKLLNGQLIKLSIHQQFYIIQYTVSMIKLAKDMDRRFIQGKILID